MQLDLILFHLINHLAGKISWLDQMMVMYAKDGPILFGLMLVWLWFAKSQDGVSANRRAVLLALGAASVALAVNQLIGAIYFRPRPFAHHIVTLLVAKSPDASFPSDHATAAFALAFTIYQWNRKFGGGMLIMALFMGFSRIFVGTHYPLDVIGGAVIGTAGALLIGHQSPRLEPVLAWVLERWKTVELKVLNKNM